MHSSGSILLDFCERVRQFLDVPDVDAKYDNKYFVQRLLTPAMSDIIARVEKMSDASVLTRTSIAIKKDTESYILPPAIRSIFRVAEINENGQIIAEAHPRGEFNPRGVNWAIEGNMIHFRPFPTRDQTLDVWHRPNGQVSSFYSATGTLESDQKTMTFTAEGNPGVIDRRPNAYLGSFIRIIPSGAITDLIEERVITEHNADTPNVKWTEAVELAAGTNIKFEIVPFVLPSIVEAVACRAAMKLGAGASKAKRETIKLEYMVTMKTVYDTLCEMRARMPKSFDGDTVDAHRAFLLNPPYHSAS